MLPASLILNGKLFAEGLVMIEDSPARKGIFRPHSPIDLDHFPQDGGILVLSDSQIQLELRNFHHHGIPGVLHRHFEFDVLVPVKK